MPRYRWTGTHAFRDHANDRVIEPDEELPDDVADQIADAHPHQVEEIDEEPEAADGDDETDSGLPDGVDPADIEEAEGTLPFNPEELSIPEIEERLGEIDDPGAVAALRGIEREQEERKGADDAFAERLEEIGAEIADE